MPHSALRRSIILLFVLMTLAIPVAAQNITGAILGSVTDPSGASIANAQVDVINVETNQGTSLRTSETGSFEALYLRPGTYRVSAASPGFKTSIRDGLTLRVEDRVRLDLRLEVGDSTAEVTVRGQTPLVETENASMGQVVSSRTVQD
ncbi:MAG: carboxypeptidase-like regulatory domain-containing protein, partial [Bryobacteraceae bacterium]